MKELTTEQKAQRYDEAIKRAKALYDNNQPISGNNVIINNIFPELKESGDEQSKNWILEYLYDGLRKSDEQFKEQFKVAIAWLEKQGEKDEEILILKGQIESLHAAIEAVKETHRIELKKQGEHAKFCDSIQIGDKVTRNEDGMLVNLSQLKRVAKPAEKQGSQNLANSAKTCKDGQNTVVAIPKFRVGDVIRPKGSTTEYTIESISGGCYRGNLWRLPIGCDDDYELVEQSPAEEYSFNVESELFQQLTKEQQGLWKKEVQQAYNAGKEASAEWSEEDEMFVHGLIRGLAAKRDIHGHTTFSSDCIDITETIAWLESLKDRVLPQPKQEWDEKDEDMIQALNACIDAAIKNGMNYISFDSKSILIGKVKNWLKNRVQQQPTKKEWSEEDERNLNDAILFIETGTYSLDKDNLINWLKSLKPQPKQKWSEEDEKIISKINSVLSAQECWDGATGIKMNPYKDVLDWLKSLRPQNRWKPSKTEIAELHNASYGQSYDKVILGALYEQIKKL